jgi:hypothetical protein
LSRVEMVPVGPIHHPVSALDPAEGNPAERPLRGPGFSYNDRVTKGDPSDGDYDRIARYEQGVIIALVIFAAAFLALIVWLGWMIL